MPLGFKAPVSMPWDLDSPQELYDVDETGEALSHFREGVGTLPQHRKYWHPEPGSLTRVHLFHHPDYEADPHVKAGKFPPSGWPHICHGDYALVLEIEVDETSPWMFKALVLLKRDVRWMGGKWLRTLEKFEEYG